MPRLLILFGTTDGQTRKIAWAMADAIESCCCHVDVLDAQGLGRTAGAEPYDGVIVAASVQAGGYQRAVVRWVRRNATSLASRPTAFVSVCLGVLEKNPETDRRLDDILRTFQAKTGWRPDAVRIVAGALRYTRYGWLKKLVMRRISAKAGGDTDTTRDFEYTDWAAVRRFGQDFAWTHGFSRSPRPAEVLAGAASGGAPDGAG